jgi:hypothetical protein
MYVLNFSPLSSTSAEESQNVLQNVAHFNDLRIGDAQHR